MKRLVLLIGLFIILILLSACTQTPTARATLIPTPTMTVEPTKAPQATPTPAPTGAPTPESTTVGPPAPTTDSSSSQIQYELFCSTTNEQARQAYSEAISLQDQGQDDKVEQLYLKAIELDPNYCDAIDNLGQLLRTLGRLDEAIALYLRSLAIYPENTVAFSNLGVVYLKLGNPSQAIEAYTRVTQIAPDDPEGYYGLGRVYYAMNKPAEAILNFSKAEEIYFTTNSPYLIDAQYYLGLTYFMQQDYTHARGYLIALYDVAGNDGTLNYILGLCYLRGEPKDLEMAGQFLLKAQLLDVVIPDEVLAEMDGVIK